MYRLIILSAFCLIVIMTSIIGCQGNQDQDLVVTKQELTKKQILGKKLFHDKNLSTPPGQACVDCHSPDTGFSNPESDLPVSRGVHKDRFGNRNDLPAAYAGFSPEFHYDADEELYVGGQFWDGRAANLAEQAKGPFLNPLEMANPDEQTVIEKIRNSDYAGLFKEVFGSDALDDTEKAYNFAVEAIAEYEMSYELNQFDSKYDFYLKGKAALTEQEMKGLALFEDMAKGNCAACHPNEPGTDGSPPLFTDYTYDNLGVPKNAENPFYYLPKELNPDGLNFIVNRDELGDLGLTEQEVDDIVAFLNILTDGYQPDKKE